MACIYPQWLSDLDRSDPSLRAEIAVYDQLSGLPDSWTVLYHASMKWRDQTGIWDREADFVIAHPELGVLVLEVKGGEIRREGMDWFTLPLSERAKPAEAQTWQPLRRSPYEQATSAAKVLGRQLNDFLKVRQPWERIELAAAVCFPDVELPASFNPGAEGLREITLDRQDLGRLEECLSWIMQAHRGEDGSGPGDRVVDALTDLIAPSWHVRSWLAYQLESGEERRRQLTLEQCQVLQSMEENPRLLIAGGAGSGKSFVALEQASRLAVAGQRVLLTCYNKNLAAWLREEAGTQSGLWIQHFHELCYELGQRVPEADLPAERRDLGGAAERYFMEQLPQALELVAIEFESLFDAVLVDEGQDFAPEWLQALQLLLADPDEGTYFLFYDGGQDLYQRGGPPPFPWPRVRLRRNVRNTDPIWQLVGRFAERDSALQPSGISGPEPRWVSLRRGETEGEAVGRVLEELQAEKVAPEDIVVLTPRSEANSRWKSGTRCWGKYAPAWNASPGVGEIRCSTVHGFKGLERPVVLLTELDQLPDGPERRRRLLYTACSRAKALLILFGATNPDELMQ